MENSPPSSLLDTNCENTLRYRPKSTKVSNGQIWTAYLRSKKIQTATAKGPSFRRRNRSNRKKIWIQDEANELQFRFLIVTHCGTAGNRETESMEQIQCEEFARRTPSEDTSILLSNCMHCVMRRQVRKFQVQCRLQFMLQHLTRLSILTFSTWG